MVVPFALSIHSFINSVGADVGFASIIGLALLVLLHFAQARETSTLRKRLDESSERIATLEGRLAQALRSVRPAAPGPPTVTPAPTGAVRAAAPSVRRVAGVAVGRPAAPMGMAAPALSSATRMITTEPPAPVPTTTPAPVAVPAFAAPVVAAAVGASAATALETSPHEPASDDTLLVAPATAAARGNGHERTAIAPPVAAAGGAAATAPPPSPPPRVKISTEPPSGPVRRTAPLPPPPRRSRFRGLLLGLLGLAIVAGVVIVLLAVTASPNQPTTAANHSHRPPARTHHPVVPRFNPRLVTVAVLNGTGVSHLAADVASKLTHGGYKVPTAMVTNAAIQTHTSTIVAYLGNHKPDAVEVAKALHLPSSSVARADHDAIGVCAGGTPGSSCSADVIVTVGTDLSSVAASAGSG